MTKFRNVAHVPASRSDNGCVELPSQPGVSAVQNGQPCVDKHRARGAKVRGNVRRDCGVESKPRLSGGTLSAWTSRPGVSSSGKHGSGGGQPCLRVPPTQRET